MTAWMSWVISRSCSTEIAGSNDVPSCLSMRTEIHLEEMQ